MDFWDNLPPLEDGGDGKDDQVLPYGMGALSRRKKNETDDRACPGDGVHADGESPSLAGRAEPDTSAAGNITGTVSVARRNKKRIAAAVIASFLIVVMIAVGVLFYDIYFNGPAVPAGGGDLPADSGLDLHQDDPSLPFAPRNARSGFMPKDLAWEINIGGGGEDILGDVLELNGIFYLFGQTNSTDYDFKGQDSGDLFMCTMNENGRLLTATAFGTPYKDGFVKARFNENGFYILSMTSASRPCATVFNVGFDGVLKDAYTYDSPRSIVPKDLYVERNMIYVCCEAVNQITQLKSPLFFALNNALIPQWYQQPDVTDYGFVAMYPASSGFVALFNGDIGGQRFPVLCRFTKTGAPETVYLKQRTSGNKIFASDMIPAADGSFLIFISDETEESAGSVIKVSRELKQTGKASAEIRQCGGGKLFYISGNVYYAVCSYVGNARGRMIVDGASELSTMPIDGLRDIGTPREHITNTGNTLFLSTTDIPLKENIMITVLNQSLAVQFQNVYGGTGVDQAVAFYTVSDGIIVFGNTDSTDGDAGGNFGRADAWVFKIKDK